VQTEPRTGPTAVLITQQLARPPNSRGATTGSAEDGLTVSANQVQARGGFLAGLRQCGLGHSPPGPYFGAISVPSPTLSTVRLEHSVTMEHRPAARYQPQEDATGSQNSQVGSTAPAAQSMRWSNGAPISRSASATTWAGPNWLWWPATRLHSVGCHVT